MGDYGTIRAERGRRNVTNLLGYCEMTDAMAELYEVATGGQSSSQQVQIMSIELTRRMMEPEVNGAKYKAVDQRKLPVAVSMPSRKREPYKPLPIPLIPELPHHPPKWTDEPYTPRLSEE